MESGRMGNPRQRMSGWRNGPWLATVLGIAVVQAVVAWQYQGPRPQPASLGPDQFSAVRALAVLQDILGDQQPHPTGSVANEQVRQRLVRHLERLELDVQLQAAVVDGQELVNVLARLGPDDGSHRPLVLATHYDSVPDGPGAADAGACVASLVETARAMQHRLAAQPLGRPVYFLFTDAEEVGLLGATALVRDHPLAERKPVVLNFDARGTSGPSLMFETHEGNLELVRHLARHLPAPAVTSSAFVTIYRLMPNNTDFTVFRQNGWAGFNFALIGGAHRYHTAEDRIEHLDLRSVQNHGDNALALGTSLATTTHDLHRSPRDAVFFDLLGWTTVWFPAQLALPLAGLACALLVGALLAHRRSLAGSTRLARASLAVVGTLAAATTGAAAAGWLAVCVLEVLIEANVVTGLYTPYDRLISIGYWAIAGTVSALGACWLLKSVPPARRFAAVWLGWSLAAIVLAAWLPGLSYLFILPVLMAAVAGWSRCLDEWSASFAAIGASLLIVPPLYLVPIALGPHWAVTQCVLFSAALTPLYATLPAEWRQAPVMREPSDERSERRNSG